MDTYSRFSKTSHVLFDGQETFGGWNNPTTKRLYDSKNVYSVDNAHEGRPDLIAHELYGDSTLDWLLISINNNIDVLNWPRAGDVIFVPSGSLIASELM